MILPDGSGGVLREPRASSSPQRGGGITDLRPLFRVRVVDVCGVAALLVEQPATGSVFHVPGGRNLGSAIDGVDAMISASAGIIECGEPVLSRIVVDGPEDIRYSR